MNIADTMAALNDNTTTFVDCIDNTELVKTILEEYDNKNKVDFDDIDDIVFILLHGLVYIKQWQVHRDDEGSYDKSNK